MKAEEHCVLSNFTNFYEVKCVKPRTSCLLIKHATKNDIDSRYEYRIYFRTNDQHPNTRSRYTAQNSTSTSRTMAATHGTIFLGKNEATYGKEGTGHVNYDPDFECGGSPGTPGRQCAFQSEQRHTEGLPLTGREGRNMQVNIASYR